VEPMNLVSCSYTVCLARRMSVIVLLLVISFSAAKAHILEAVESQSRDALAQSLSECFSWHSISEHFLVAPRGRYQPCHVFVLPGYLWGGIHNVGVTKAKRRQICLQVAAALIKNHNLVGVPIHLPDVAWRCGHQSEIKIYRCTKCCKEKVPAKRIWVVMLLRLWW
jgi:hypothetical protein